MTAASPRGAGTVKRVATIDVLRGFALFGILLINIVAFKAPWGPPGLGCTGPLSDRLVLGTLILLVESKFFTLFSLLFGLSFSVQMANAEAGGVRFAALFLRRLAVLLLFGVAHVTLAWEGDILILYSLIGGLLLLFRRARPRALLWWAGCLLALNLLAYSAAFAGVQVARSSPGWSEKLREADASLAEAVGRKRAVAVRGDDPGYIPSVGRRLKSYIGLLPLELSRVPTVLAMFLLGLYVGRTGLLSDAVAHAPLLRQVRGWGLGLGLPVALLVALGYALAPPTTAIATLLFNQALAGPLLALGYGATVALLACQPGWESRLRPLAMTGRMSLTNYLAQSLACATLFSPWGLGLAGRTSPAAAMVVAVAIFAGQVALSSWWVSRFRYGPAEWVWRSLTYCRIQPLLR